MGTVTAAALISRVRQLTEHDLTELISDASLLELLNEVYSELWNAYAWPQSILSSYALVDPDGTAALPADYRSMYSVKGGVLDVPAGGTAAATLAADGVPELYPLRQRTVDPDDWDDATGVATEFTVDGSVIRFWPRTTQYTYVSLRYIGPPAQFANTSSVWAFHDEFAPALAYGASARLLAQEADDSGRIAAYQREYEAMIQRMRVVYLNEVLRSFPMGGRPVRVVERKGRRRRVRDA